MDTKTAYDLIQQGRIRVNNRLYFNPNHGIWAKPGMKFSIDKIPFRFYPRLHIMYNKPHSKHIQSMFANNPSLQKSDERTEEKTIIFPTYFFNRKKGSDFKTIFALPKKMSGLVIFSDDEQWINYYFDNNILHTFEVYFVHSLVENERIRYQRTDWNLLQDECVLQSLLDGMLIKCDNKQITNLDSIQLLDDNCIDDEHKYRMSKWKIETKHHLLFDKLLRKQMLYPYFIHRTGIDSLFLNDNESEIHLFENEWRIMNESEIKSIGNYYRAKITEISRKELLTCYTWPSMEQLYSRNFMNDLF